MGGALIFDSTTQHLKTIQYSNAKWSILFFLHKIYIKCDALPHLLSQSSWLNVRNLNDSFVLAAGI
jgi:hypothetical protein